MKVHETGFGGLLVFELENFADGRGLFRETFRQDIYASYGVQDVFVQDNHSHSQRGVLRGLHFRTKRPQAQIVTVIRGAIFDVVVDVRGSSPTFGRWFGVELSEEGLQQVYMAPGFAHGFCVVSSTADLHYKVSQTFDASDDAGLAWNDSDLAISWPIRDPIVSPRDAGHPPWSEVMKMVGGPS